MDPQVVIELSNIYIYIETLIERQLIKYRRQLEEFHTRFALL